MLYFNYAPAKAKHLVPDTYTFAGALYRADFMIKQCLICEKDFHVPLCRKDGAKFCSYKCYGIWRSRNIIGSRVPNWKGGKIEKSCMICGGKFKTTQWYIDRNSGKFCSHACYSKNLIGKNVGEKSARWVGGGIEKKCGVCGKIFNIKSAKSRNNRGKYCSKKCYIIWQQTNMKREKSPRWKGVTEYRMAIRNMDKYGIWRKQVFERDNFTCQKCRKRGYKIHAHHVKKFSFILNDMKQKFPLLNIKDIADYYPDLWDISNGITLCKDCHKKIHKRNGY